MPCISESVQIALVTFASGVLGAVLGVVGVTITAKYSASAQMKQTVIQEYFKQRADSFSAFLAACERLNYDPFPDENISAYLETKERAILVASPYAQLKIQAYHTSRSGKHSSDEEQVAYSAMVLALKEDLFRYPEPSVSKRSLRDYTRRKIRKHNTEGCV